MLLPRRLHRLLPPLALLCVLVSPGAELRAQQPYRQPPPPIDRILEAAPLPRAELSPDRRWLLLLREPGLPPVTELLAPELRLAGLRLDPRTSRRSRTTPVVSLELVDLATASSQRVALADGTRIDDVAFSPDAGHLAWSEIGPDGLTLQAHEIRTGWRQRLSERRLNGVFGAPCAWQPDGRALVCRLVPEGRGEPPRRAAAAGPVVQQTTGEAAANPTHQDLLRDEADAALFEHYATSQLARLHLDGRVEPLGEPGLHVTAEPSPDGAFLLVETLHRPYSYVVPWRRFPRRVELWEREGRRVREVADVPLQESVPVARDAVPTGPREVAWRADAPATLAWSEAVDGGDPAREAKVRDRLLQLAAPFVGPPQALVEVGYRLERVFWGRSDLALVREEWWKSRRSRTWAIDPERPQAAPRLLFDRSSEERYGDPGDFVTVPDARGRQVLLLTRDGRGAYLTGAGANPEGDQPFLDRIDLASGATARLWRSEPPHYEEVVGVLDPEAQRVVLRRESPTEVPDYFLRDFAAQALARLTDLADPAPELAGVVPELVRYRRKDGVELSGRLYLPPGHDPAQGPLPFLLWAYPREFKSAAAAGQVSGSPHRFTRPAGASHLLLLTQGYGILDGPTMPIVGEGGAEPNDTYVEQLVASAGAAVDYLVGRGVADRERLAIGGHSYGAFMAANLLAHSDLFRAGIARSGAYNRTLTPFGFQAEDRSFWQARDVYLRMSPFAYADRIQEPVLLIHGQDDDNSGTFPLQSERFFAALQGNGGTARLVLLPGESHGYRGRESVGHALAEMAEWLERYVKAATPREPRRR